MPLQSEASGGSSLAGTLEGDLGLELHPSSAYLPQNADVLRRSEPLLPLQPEVLAMAQAAFAQAREAFMGKGSGRRQ